MSQEALRVFEEIRSDLRRNNKSSSRIDQTLACLYFEQAMAARMSGKIDIALLVEGLEDLCRNPPSTARLYGRSKEATADSTACQKLALWYRLEGENTSWKELLKPIFRRSIQILRDDNIQNDAEGYRILAGVLFQAGNTQQAIAALSPLLLPFAREQARYRSPEHNHNLSQSVEARPENLEGTLKQAATSDESLIEGLTLVNTDQTVNQQTKSAYQANN